MKTKYPHVGRSAHVNAIANEALGRIEALWDILDNSGDPAAAEALLDVAYKASDFLDSYRLYYPDAWKEAIQRSLVWPKVVSANDPEDIRSHFSLEKLGDRHANKIRGGRLSSGFTLMALLGRANAQLIQGELWSRFEAFKGRKRHSRLRDGEGVKEAFEASLTDLELRLMRFDFADHRETAEMVVALIELEFHNIANHPSIKSGEAKLAPTVKGKRGETRRYVKNQLTQAYKSLAGLNKSRD